MKKYVVEVNEGVIEATRQGVEWWHVFSARFRNTGRMHETKSGCIVGGVVEVACDSEGDAVWLADQMVVNHGLPRTAVRVKRAAGGAS